MILDFRLPDIGEGVAEGEIVSWLVKPGDLVNEHQGVVEVSTDKAVVEVPAPANGRIVKLLAAAGEVVPTHSIIFQMEVGEPGERAPSLLDASAGIKEGSSPVTAASATAVERPEATRRAAAPSARRVARELNVDLDQVSGSGRNGLIRRSDVELFASAAHRVEPQSAAPEIRPQQGDVSRTPFIGLRRKIAAQMTRAKSTAAHFTVVEEVDVTELVRLMARAKQIGDARGVKVTYTGFLMRALASALLEHPSLNAMLDESANEIVTYRYVNLGVAIDTPHGLVVPVVNRAERLTVLELSAALAKLTDKARAGKLTREEMQGGTFTLSNAGQIGSIHATPIINVPEVGILGAHRILKRPGVVESADGDRIEVRHYMNLSMSVDHRLADGMVAVKALVHIRKLLETPALLAL